MSDALQIITVPAFEDNYLWLIASNKVSKSGQRDAYAVDPGDAEAISNALELNQLKLKGILTTHHHFDHVGGVAELVGDSSLAVYGPKLDKIPCQTKVLEGGETPRLAGLGISCEVLFVPGHTLGHIAYFFKEGFDWPVLFCGDTLFAGGCGRLLGGTADQLYESLEKLKTLDPNTRVYCAHEYTIANLQFAQAVEPGNADITQRLEAVKRQRDNGEPSIPSLLEEELKTNPFLRCDAPEVVQSACERVPEYGDDGLSVFTILRKWKDTFKPAA